MATSGNHKIGIIREGKTPPDHRAPLSPLQCAEVKKYFPGHEVVVQASPVRAYKDEEYKKAGIPVVDTLHDCDLILGIKEVPVEELIEGKTYLFFSHTIKKQPHNQKLLKAALTKKIRLLDYECLVDEDDHRIIGFGHYAGIIGAYNGIMGYGKRYNLFNLKRAIDCADRKELWEELKKINLPNLKIIVTGNGRVANGAVEVLGALNIRRVTPYEFLNFNFREATYTQLHSYNYFVTKDGSSWKTQEFYDHPDRYKADFISYAKKGDLLINCSFWDPRAPKVLTREDMMHPDFRLSVIADVSCDIGGPIASTIRASSIPEPFYGYDPTTAQERDPFGQEAITVMAVDNLPCELPRDSSENFGKELIEKVFPSLLGEDKNGLINRAVICQDGKLSPSFEYLHDYAYL